MRISTSSMTQNMSNNIVENEKKYQDLQNKISAGGQLIAPDEDPLAYSYVNKLKDVRTQINRYGATATSLQTDLHFYDNQFQQATDMLKDIRTLALEAGNGSLDDEDRKTVANQINSDLNQLIAVGNSNVQGKYMFAGSVNTKAPFKVTNNGDKVTDVTYVGDTAVLNREVGFNDTMKVNYNGEEAFANQSGNGIDMYREIIALRDDVLSGNAQKITGHLDRIDASISQVQSYRTLNGNKITHLQNLQATWSQMDINYAKNADNIGTENMASLINALNTQQLSYQSTLYIAGTLGKISILNYL
jgi:flagellar hook-associated protein 3 FlgL